MQLRLLFTQHPFAVASNATVVRTFGAELVIERPDEFRGCIAHLSGGDYFHGDIRSLEQTQALERRERMFQSALNMGLKRSGRAIDVSGERCIEHFLMFLNGSLATIC